MADMSGSRTSRITGLLSFYDEPLELLAAHVSSLSGVVDHLVAVDGAYFLYPQAQPSSDPSQMRLIEEICRGLRIGLTTHTPSQVWAGNEVQKRNHMVTLAEPVTDPNGWYIVLDADCIVTKVADDWFQQMEQAAKDGWGAAEISVREVREIPGVAFDPQDSYGPIRLMYRAVPNLTYGPAHWCIHAPDPETGERIFFWGPPDLKPVDAFNARHLLKFDHRMDRPDYRAVNARKYYLKREQLGVENGSRMWTRGLDGEYHEYTPEHLRGTQ